MGSYIVLLYFLPLYFQSVLGASPIKSGVNNLPLVLAAAVFALAGGAVVMKTGRAQQVMFVGSMLATVAIGLIYTLDVNTPTAKWVGYQFFVGASMAIAIMHGLTIAQANVGPEDLAAATANLLCTLMHLVCESGFRTDRSYSLPDYRRGVQHLSKSVCVFKQAACHFAANSSFGRPTTRATHGGIRVAECFWRRCAPWCFEGLHDWSQSCVRSGSRFQWRCLPLLFGNSEGKATNSHASARHCGEGVEFVRGVDTRPMQLCVLGKFGSWRASISHHNDLECVDALSMNTRCSCTTGPQG